jgi:hypothetical protein
MMLAHDDGLMRRYGVTVLLLTYAGRIDHSLEGRSADRIPVRHVLETASFQRQVNALQCGPLANAGVAGAYVLVGHALGGKDVRRVALRYPDQVPARCWL